MAHIIVYSQLKITKIHQHLKTGRGGGGGGGLLIAPLAPLLTTSLLLKCHEKYTVLI